MLRTVGLAKSFGGLRALQGVCAEALPGEILSVIGPNGAGKTTLFNCLTGIYRPDAGEILLEGRSIGGRQPFEVSRLGVSRTFQNIRLFPEMTALDNVMVAQYHRNRVGVADILLRTRRYRETEARGREEALGLLADVGLGAHADDLARNLAYGLQRRLEIARALGTAPKVLLLDEPGAGMNPSEIGDLVRLIGALRSRGLAIILIEHHMRVVMEISNRILVLDHGEPIACGTPAEVRANPRVIEAYLGSDGAKEAGA